MLVDGWCFRIPCVVGDVSGECLAAVVDNSILGERVARELDAIAEPCGYPCMVVPDNSAELISNAIFAWQQDCCIAWHYIARGRSCKPPSWKTSTDDSVMSAATSISTAATGMPEKSPRVDAATTL